MTAFLSSLSSPGAALINIGPIILRWYGFLIAISLLIGVNLSNKLSQLRGLKKNTINDLLPWLVLFSIIGARLYYVLFELRQYSGLNFWASISLFEKTILFPRFLEIWSGGIAIHGALLGGSISIILFSRLRKINFWDVLDVTFPSVILGQAIGRWGNFFNNEAFGTPTNLPWKLFIPISKRPLLYLQDNYFHPTFLYESIWNIVLFIFLLMLFKLAKNKSIKLPSGVVTCCYLVFYSIGRFFIEEFRIDSLCIGSLPPSCSGGIRIAQLISLAFISVGVLGLYWVYIKKKKLPTFNILKVQKTE